MNEVLKPGFRAVKDKHSKYWVVIRNPIRVLDEDWIAEYGWFFEKRSMARAQAESFNKQGK